MQINLFTKHPHRHREQTYGYHKGKGGEGINQGFGMNRYTPLCIKLIDNKDLPYSRGNYTQYLEMTYNVRKSGKKYIQIYYCAAHLKQQYCKSSTV